jgi:D-alanine-D-alanine ligase
VTIRTSPELLRQEPAHWTGVVYRDHAELFYDVEAALFQNADLTRQELALVDELADRIGRPVTSPVADLACGPGRHTVELASRGLKVTGVDLSLPFLRMARRAAGGAPSPARFVCGDLRQLQFADGAFASVLLLGNSFGYFADNENLAILREMRRLLHPGGLLCLEITRRDAYLATLVPYEEEIVLGRLHDRLRCQWWKSWDEASQRVITRERHSLPDTGEVVYEGPYDIRLYGWQELHGMLRRTGFRSPIRAPFTPAAKSLDGGLGETFGAMSEVLFVATVAD